MAFSEDYKICWYLGIALILQPIRVSELSISSQAYVLRLTDDLCIQYIEKSPASKITTLPVMLHKTLYQHVDPFELNNLRSSHLEILVHEQSYLPCMRWTVPTISARTLWTELRFTRTKGNTQNMSVIHAPIILFVTVLGSEELTSHNAE
ncbi:hypothetical protein CRM22_007201 [Opisthorchis felineus]|uniref:Uncharacterized protein n=1 Tax=Opisthorchis felineus TaxID=147828 RepID=A0A4S2LQ98_OPIFE|nr:hypothetical protein CRM22_007201 [Opisthorchis felineus]